jgi:prepilin-type processing-associated H-X9-DG protein
MISHHGGRVQGLQCDGHNDGEQDDNVLLAVASLDAWAD